MSQELVQKIESIFSQKLKSLPSQVEKILLSAIVHRKRGVTLFEKEVETVEVADEIKMGVWLRSEGRWGSSSFENVSEESLDQSIVQALEASRFNDPELDYQLASSQSSAEKPIAYDEVIEKLTLQDFEKISREMDGQARALSLKITNIPDLGAGADRITRIIMNSEGVRVREDNAYVKAGLSVMAEGDDHRPVNVHEMEYGRSYSQFHVKDIVDEVVHEVLGRMNPKSVTSGAYPVIFDARTTAQLLGSFWSIFSGDWLYKKLTRLEGKIGESIASDCMTIIDDPLLGLSPHHFDAEGTPSQSRLLIEKGIFKGFLHNLYSAKKCGVTTTGNAGGGLGESPSVSPTNLRVEGKITPLADIMGGVKKGILIRELHGASASPISGDFSFGGLGYLIESGKVIEPIADFTVAGNFFEVLKKIEAIGDDLRFFSPGLLSSFGGRSLLVSELAISGK